MSKQPVLCKLYPLSRDLNKTWFLEYTDPITGKKQKKYGELNKLPTIQERIKAAEKLMQKINIQIHTTPTKKNPYPGLDIPRLIEVKFEARCVYLKPKSIATYHTKVLEFVTWYRRSAHLPDIQAQGIGVAYIKHLQEANRTNTTINAYRNTIKSLFADLETEIPINPFKKVRKLKERRKSFKYFDETMQAELRDIMIQEDPELWLACQCEYYLLLRPNELRTIKVGAFNTRNCTICVEGDISKNQYTQFITIPNQFVKQLSFVNDYPPHFFLFGKNGKPGVYARYKKYFPDRHQELLKRHNYDTRDYKFYSWKHTGAVMYYVATGDVKGLKEQGRWHSLDMVNEYLKNLGVLDIVRVRQDFPVIGGKID